MWSSFARRQQQRYVPIPPDSNRRTLPETQGARGLRDLSKAGTICRPPRAALRPGMVPCDVEALCTRKPRRRGGCAWRAGYRLRILRVNDLPIHTTYDGRTFEFQLGITLYDEAYGLCYGNTVRLRGRAWRVLVGGSGRRSTCAAFPGRLLCVGGRGG